MDSISSHIYRGLSRATSVISTSPTAPASDQQLPVLRNSVQDPHSPQQNQPNMLRRPYRRPSTPSPPPSPPLDCTSQETIITSLQTADARRSAIYRRLLLLLPLVAGAQTVVRAVTATGKWDAALAVLAAGSLGFTAWGFADSEGTGREWKRWVGTGNAGLAVVLAGLAVWGWRVHGRDGEEVLGRAMPLGEWTCMVWGNAGG